MNNKHALIIDDDREIADFFKIVLGMAGFHCDVANSAKTALALLSSVEPDLIILDMNLGLDLGGGDLLYQVRSNPRFDATRVIVITAYPAMAEAIHNLADLVLLKPIEVSQLKTLAERVMAMEGKPYLFRDPGTNLYHLKFFMLRLEHAFDRAKRRPDFRFAVLAIEFEIEPHGQASSDLEEREQLLKLAAEQMQASFRITDTLSRMSGERIAVLLEEIKQERDIEVITERLRKRLAQPFEVKGRSVQLHSWIGAVLYDGRISNAQVMLDLAKEAVVKVRNEGRRLQLGGKESGSHHET